MKATTCLGSLALALGGLGALPALAQDQIARIGVLAPLTGGSAADGQEMVNGAQLAVDEINAAGGVAGYMLEIVEGDTQDQTAEAVTTAFERLAGDPDVNVMMSGYASGSNFEIEMMAEQEMPYLISGNSAQTRDIIAPDPDSFPTVWSITPSYDAYETEMIPVLDALSASGALALPNKKVALISSDNPYSKTIMDGLAESFGAGGWDVTSTDLLPFGAINDWRAFLAGVRQNEPAVIINTDYQPGNAATFVQQFLEQPTNSLVFIQYAPSVPEFTELTGDASTGIIYNLLGGPLESEQNPRAAEVIGKYEERFGTTPGFYGPALYEQVYLYAEALEKVGDPTDRLAIGEAIAAADKQIVSGHLRFDPATHLAVQGNEGIPIQFFQIWDGERVLFYPDQYATGDFRLPPWMK
ncbi:ABC transporter substrate-binding protein [Rubellimicrobium arenae]|uniref:ABC transporter substrate-binding protein n=1 Tax=Rubellimicrobium arenae TaxID=2817372 RepID=UPI001B30A94B|nr:ABC transporter substrate-binding protein [Rubellimicrobium arenae]